MKLIAITAGIFIVIIIFAGGCYYDKRDLVYPSQGSSGCDTVNVTYSITIKNIMAANCYSCHSGSAAAGGGVVLDNYNSILPYIKSGQLIKDVAQTTGANPMPKGGTKLDNCSINKIIAWVNKATPNN